MKKRVTVSLTMTVAVIFLMSTPFTALALQIELGFEPDTTFFVDPVGTDPWPPTDLLGIELLMTNDTSNPLDIAFYASGFSSTGNYLYNNTGQTFDGFSLDAGETIVFDFMEVAGVEMDFSDFSWESAEIGDVMNVPSLSLYGLINGSDMFTYEVNASDFAVANLFHVEVGSGPGTAPVPEPATMLLFGTGLAGLLGVARKKNKK